MNEFNFQQLFPIFTTPDGKEYDQSVVNLAESRVGEIAIVTPTKAPELMTMFSKACFALGRILPDVYLGHQRAIKRTANRKAILTIDVIPQVMAEKKLAQNETHRQAILELDQEYSRLCEEEAQFDAAVLYFKRKIADMEGALNAVKKILADNEGVYRRPNYNMTETQFEEQPTSSTSSGFKVGKAKY